MAIIGRSESGFLVDHEKSISEAVSALSVVCKEGLFDLFEPYFRSAAENTDGTRKRKRKKSAKAEPTDEDIEAAVYHQKVSHYNDQHPVSLYNVTAGSNLQVRQTIATGVKSLVRIGLDKGHFCFRDHENSGRDIVMSDQNLSSEKDLLGRMICHHDDKPTVLSISGQQYILPANCSFLMSDASNFKPLVDYAQQSGLYDLVVLDPPWFNKSAKRGSKYSFMSLWQIKSLPVPQLLAPGALVGIWVTNKQKYLRFTKSELFPHWSVELVAEWYWVKVTKRGELVTDLDSPHKKPYEPLLIGRFRPKIDEFRTTTLKSAKEFESNNDIVESCSAQRREPDNKSSPQMKRKKISKCYNFDKTENRCSCEKDRNVTAMIPEWPSSIYTTISQSVVDLNHAEYRKNKTDQPDNLLEIVAHQSTNKHCMNCQKLLHINKEAPLDNTTSLSDDDERTSQNSTGKHASKWTSEICTGLNVENCGRDDRLATNQTGAVSESTLEACDVLPYHQVICSVPCKIHSRKPPLSEILTQYVPAKSLCLEMFARNLTPHWTSWGNEVLKFQSMEYFEQLAPKEEEKLNLNTD